MVNRVCKKCGNTDEQKHIYAVVNEVNQIDYNLQEIIADCLCSACGFRWQESTELQEYPWDDAEGNAFIYQDGDDYVLGEDEE